MHFHTFLIFVLLYFSFLVLLIFACVNILFILTFFSIFFFMNLMRKVDSKFSIKTWSNFCHNCITRMHYHECRSFCVVFLSFRAHYFFIFFLWISSIFNQISNSLIFLKRFEIITLFAFCFWYRVFWSTSQYLSRSRDRMILKFVE